ncbi:cytochrome P450 [Thozetella sp. PMI_491]|nr:cytochrome P450 [Thozetella sp. PMI_491]
MSALLLAQACAALTLLFFLVQRWYRTKSRPSLPPGPKGLPLVGNIFDLPPPGVPEYRHWLKHKDKYGPLSSVTVLGNTIIIIHDKKMASELLEKRATKNSGRPQSEFAANMCSMSLYTGYQEYNDDLKLQRKLMHKLLGTRAGADKYNAIQDIEVRRFLLRLLDKPENLFNHLETEAAAIILKLTYGYTVDTEKMDPLVDLVSRQMANFSEAAVPGAWMVDLIPSLKYLPDWLPGTGFKKIAREWSKVSEETPEIPLKYVQARMADKSYQPSFTSTLLEEGAGKLEPGFWELNLKYASASLYTGGADTTVGSLQFFFLAMVLHPEVQRKAQEEIDRVIGPDRLPSAADRDRLPYIQHIVKETARWMPLGPMGLPHKSDADDVYAGYHIPKGAILMTAFWWFAHDPAVYASPDTFEPDRYAEPRNEPDPEEFTFGHGRRVCPGQHLARASMFLTIAQTLAVFDILKGVDRDGNELEAQLETIPGIVAHPVEFPFRIVPRSEKHASLIRSSQPAAEESDASYLGRKGLMPQH